jgi:hypothetical protein
MSKFLDRLTWAYAIIVGGLLITPGGINPIVTNPGFRVVIGIVSIVLGAACFLTHKQAKSVQ